MNSWGAQRGGHMGAMSHALTIVDGLIDAMDERHVAIEFLEVMMAQSLTWLRCQLFGWGTMLEREIDWYQVECLQRGRERCL